LLFNIGVIYYACFGASLNNLAELLKAQGDAAAARPLFEQALAICKEAFGDRHPATVECLNYLARLERDRLWEQTQKLRAAGKTAEALAAAEALLALERRISTENHADLAGSLDWLAQLQVEREDFAAATAARREALDLLRKRLGASDWRVVDARLALADVERLAGMDRDQRARLAEADRLNRTVEDLYGAGRYAEAIPAAHQALAIRQAVLGERHPDTARSLNDLAGLLEAQGDYTAARPLYEQALTICKVRMCEDDESHHGLCRGGPADGGHGRRPVDHRQDAEPTPVRGGRRQKHWKGC
jgi:tetratricopeptide (TPR) repeat protein